MQADGFTIFETAIGPCAVAWRGQTIAGSQLPERDEAAVRSRMRVRFPAAPEAAPPEHVARAIARIGDLIAGAHDDLTDLQLDTSDVPEFNRRVYEIARAIPPGSTLTYGEIAMRLGDRAHSRAVGQALASNPFAPIVPCHRVVSADGMMHGFSARGGLALKLRMLRTEGWRANEPSLFD
jgi:methylated-DNA-[protein]-cysteine S-methyltransferase